MVYGNGTAIAATSSAKVVRRKRKTREMTYTRTSRQMCVALKSECKPDGVPGKQDQKAASVGITSITSKALVLAVMVVHTMSSLALGGFLLLASLVNRVEAFQTLVPSTKHFSDATPSRQRLVHHRLREKTETKEALEEAEAALTSVGWAMPLQGEGEMTSEDPFVQEIDAGIQRDFGVPLEDLLNPAKVVNLERDLYNLRFELAQLTGMTVDTAEDGSVPKETSAYDGGGGGEDAEAIRQKIDKKEKDLLPLVALTMGVINSTKNSSSCI